MQELRIVLIIVGIILIIALLAHGYWSSRKNRPPKIANAKTASAASSASRDDQGFDEFGLGEARVVGDPIDQHVEKRAQQQTAAEPAVSVEAPAPRSEPQVSSTVEPTLSTEKTEPAFSFSALDEEPKLAEPAVAADAFQPAEPVLADEQELPVAEPVIEPEVAIAAAPSAAAQRAELIEEEPKAEPEAEPEAAPKALEGPDDVFVINVMAQSNRSIKGPALVDALNSLGMRFGEMDIFHRHLDNAGEGPIIFSLASMVNPGTFDMDNIAAFETRGVSLFMTVPCKGEPSKNFQQMHHVASSLAKQFEAILLDDQRNPLTKQTVNHYEQRIREFERKQLLVN